MAIPPAEELQRRMAQTREHLYRSSEMLMRDMGELLDWKYHLLAASKRYLGQHPWISASVAAGLGYLAVCWWRKPVAVQPQVPFRVQRDQWLKQLVGLAGNTLIRAGMAYASQQLAKALREKSVEAGSSANG